MRRGLPRFQGENLQRNVALVVQLEEMARAKGCSAPQLALAWLLAKGSDIVPIPGTKRRRYLEDNAEAADTVLTPREVTDLDQAFPVGSAAGERYPAASMKLLETEGAV